jgi:glycosyltransferase involved in cell wall biosynthesis
MSLAWLLAPQLEAFVRAGYEVIGVSAPGPFAAGLAERGVTHVPWPHATRAMAPVDDLRSAVELYRILRHLRPDIVHTHNPKPGWFGRPIARLAGVPVVVNTVHGLYAAPDDGWAKRAVVYGLERAAAAASHGELVQNPEDLVQLERLRVPPARLHLLGNGIDLGRFDPDRPDRAERRDRARRLFGAGPEQVVVGMVGRLVAEKGVAEVLAAAQALAEHEPSLRWVLIGPGEPAKADGLDVDALAVRAGSEVVLLGRRDDVDELYPGFDLFVLASHREGFPRAAMEAAAMGLPVVATDIRGCRQVVDDGVTGRLVPVGDAQALATAVGDLARAPEVRLAMGRAGRAKAAEEFDQRRCISVTLALYRRLLADG